jgi:hypothetical protein
MAKRAALARRLSISYLATTGESIMATVELRGQGQRVTDRMPTVCACCGAAATLSDERKLVWQPKWIYALAALGGIPFVIALLVMQKRMDVRLPLCADHAHPWRKLNIVRVLALLHLLVFSWVAIMASAILGRSAEESGGSGAAALAVMGGWLLILVLLFIAFFVQARRSIRPTLITDDRMTLAGVSPAFAQGVLACQTSAPAKKPVPVGAM